MSVFHLKYRPNKISELDLPEVVDALRKFLNSKEIPQSFLFSGPKGSGKTSAARILAKALNCLNRKDGEPCDKCDNCQEILKGRAIDVMEMDAASNRGIEDVRSLKDKAYLSPSKLKYKIFIIDEVHMMTKEAFNALLKLIEEPPKHTVFILCTTDVSKIPETILSRLVVVDFRKGKTEELKKSLKKVIDGEKINLAKEAFDLIISKSDGSFRNLQKNFNELVLLFGKKIITENVISYYSNKSGDYNEVDFESDLLLKDTKKILEKLEKMSRDGADFVFFRQKLLEYFMDKLLLVFGVGDGKRSELGLTQLESLINLLIRAAKQEKEVEIDQLPIELVVIDFLNNDKDFSGNQNFRVEDNRFSGVEDKKSSLESKKDKIVKDEKIKTGESLKSKPPLVLEVTGITFDKIIQSWGNVLLAIKPINHSVEAFLRASRPIKYQDRKLILEVFYPFHKDRLEEQKNKRIVENGLYRVFGVEIIFDCVLGKSRKAPLIIQNDTPVESVSKDLVEKKEDRDDLYDVAKDIFG